MAVPGGTAFFCFRQASLPLQRDLIPMGRVAFFYPLITFLSIMCKIPYIFAAVSEIICIFALNSHDAIKAK